MKILKGFSAALSALALAAGAACADTYAGPWLPITNITVTAADAPVALQWDDFSNLIGVQLYATDSLEAPDWQPVHLSASPLLGMTDVYGLSTLGGSVDTAGAPRKFFRLRGVRGAPPVVPPGTGSGVGTNGAGYVFVNGPDGLAATCDDVLVSPAGPGDVDPGTGIITVPPGAEVSTGGEEILVGGHPVPPGSLVLPDGTIVIDTDGNGSTGINPDGTVTVGPGDTIALPPYDAPFVVPAPGGVFDPAIPGVTLVTVPPTVVLVPGGTVIGGGTTPSTTDDYVIQPGPDSVTGTPDDVRIAPAGAAAVDLGTGIVTVPGGSAVTTNGIPIIIGAPVNGLVPPGSLVLPDGTVVIDTDHNGSTGINPDGTVTVGPGDVIALPPYGAPYVVPAPGGVFDPALPGVILGDGAVAALPPVPVAYAASALGTVINGTPVAGLTVATATAGGQAISYALQAGALPAGLSLDAAGGVNGTPAGAPGTFTFTVRATAVNGLHADAVWVLALIAAYPSDPLVTWEKADQTIMIDLTNGYKVAVLPADYDVSADPASQTAHLYLRRIQGGTFTMGSPGNEAGHGGYEGPISVNLTKAFYAGVYPVTVYQYEYLNNNAPSGSSLRTPKTNVPRSALRGSQMLSTVPASGWLKRLTEAVAGNPANAGLGLTFDLPTEAQWEYACRAGTTGTYNDSDDIALTAEAAAARIFTLGWFASNDAPDGAKEVGLKKANRAGLYDMHGNVWEFCRDTWSGNTGLPGGDDPLSSGTDGVFRGGYWGSTSQFCRSAYRYKWRLAEADVSIGFRVIAVGP